MSAYCPNACFPAQLRQLFWHAKPSVERRAIVLPDAGRTSPLLRAPRLAESAVDFRENFAGLQSIGIFTESDSRLFRPSSSVRDVAMFWDWLLLHRCSVKTPGLIVAWRHLKD